MGLPPFPDALLQGWKGSKSTCPAFLGTGRGGGLVGANGSVELSSVGTGLAWLAGRCGGARKEESRAAAAPLGWETPAGRVAPLALTLVLFAAASILSLVLSVPLISMVLVLVLVLGSAGARAVLAVGNVGVVRGKRAVGPGAGGSTAGAGVRAGRSPGIKAAAAAPKHAASKETARMRLPPCRGGRTTSPEAASAKVASSSGDRSVWRRSLCARRRSNPRDVSRGLSRGRT